MNSSRIPLARPDVDFNEVADDIRAILDSGILTSGPYVARFEHAVAALVGVEHAVATTSATTALHLTLAALGVGPGDDVLVADFTFPATANVVVQLGARPILVDCAPGSFAIDPDVAESLMTPRTVAVIPVDPFGQPADLPRLDQLATRHGIALVEDAACALGAEIAGRPCGSWPVAGCFSFHPRKTVTTGEGGMVTTADAELAATLRRLRNHGGAPAAVGMCFTDNGFNYRMSEIAAALGLAQLRRFDQILADRRRCASCYRELLGRVPGIAVPELPPDGHCTYQSFVVVLDANVDRDAVVHTLRARGIETTLGTYALHAQPAFARFGYRPGDLPNSWHYQRQSLTLPLLPGMADPDIEAVVDALAHATAAATRG